MYDKPVHIVFQVLNYISSNCEKNNLTLPVHRLLLLILAKHHGVKGIYPSTNTLAKELHVSRRYITTLLLYLESINLIKIERNKGRSNHYSFPFLSTDLGTTDHMCTVDHMGTTDHNTCDLQFLNLGTTDHTININNQQRRNKTERAALSSFSPSDQNLILCQELRLNLEEELMSFKNRHRGKKDQYEFGRWLKGSYQYKQKNLKVGNEEVRCTVPEWGPGHPSWDSMNAIPKPIVQNGTTQVEMKIRGAKDFLSAINSQFGRKLNGH